jgi:IS5 family transposase
VIAKKVSGNEKKVSRQDLLERLDNAIDWELFRPVLNKLELVERKNSSGRKRLDSVLMFKVLVLKRLHNLSDDQTEYQIRDRMSFQRFLGFGLLSSVPDAKSIWLFGERIKIAGIEDELFERFHYGLQMMGVTLRSGQIIDASYVTVPIQRNTRAENADIKQDQMPAEWENQPHKCAQKDLDARFTKKGGVTYYGYKDHTNADRRSKLITAYTCSPAHVHDSQPFDGVLRSPEQGGAGVWADGAYQSEACEKSLDSLYISRIHERAYRNKPLTEQQRKTNRLKSTVRARIEHVYGTMTNSFGGKIIRSIGLARAKVNIALLNLTYNIFRLEFLIRSKFFTFDRLIAPKF